MTLVEKTELLEIAWEDFVELLKKLKEEYGLHITICSSDQGLWAYTLTDIEKKSISEKNFRSYNEALLFGLSAALDKIINNDARKYLRKRGIHISIEAECHKRIIAYKYETKKLLVYDDKTCELATRRFGWSHSYESSLKIAIDKEIKLLGMVNYKSYLKKLENDGIHISVRKTNGKYKYTIKELINDGELALRYYGWADTSEEAKEAALNDVFCWKNPAENNGYKI